MKGTSVSNNDDIKIKNKNILSQLYYMKQMIREKKMTYDLQNVSKMSPIDNLIIN